MNYIVEYEVINSKFCGIVKNPYSGVPEFISELCETQEQVTSVVNNYISNNNNRLLQEPPKKSCCGRH